MVHVANVSNMPIYVKISLENMILLSRVKTIGSALDLSPLGQLDRKVYLDLNKILEAAGGKWNRGKKVHLFDGDATEILDTLLTTGEVTDRKKELQFFPTPMPLAAELVSYANVKKDDEVLEPSAGTGNIARALLDVGAIVTAVERDSKMREGLRDLFQAKRGFVVDEDDIMDFDGGRSRSLGGFDAVVANPPFRKVGKGDHRDHCRHTWELLRPGGTSVFVFPQSVIFRQDKAHVEFRKWCEKRGALTPLPEGSFRESGTDVATCVFVGKKS